MVRRQDLGSRTGETLERPQNPLAKKILLRKFVLRIYRVTSPTAKRDTQGSEILPTLLTLPI